MTRDEDTHLIAIMMRDQTTIEQLAVSAVTTAITKCPHLSCEIRGLVLLPFLADTILSSRMVYVSTLPFQT